MKVPIFQLFDWPIIYRSTPSGSILKLRTNSISIGVDMDRRDGVTHLKIFNKSVPLSVLLSSYHTKEEFW